MEEINIWFWAFVVFIVVDLLIVFYIVFRRFSKKLPESERRYVQNNWERIEQMYLNDPRQALLEADKLLDHLLKKVTKSQVSLGQNLKENGAYFSDLNAVWFAHKLRNKVAHELNFTPTKTDFEKSKRYFKRALKDLGA